MLQTTTDKALVTARDKELKQLKQAISENRIPVLTAAPGLGRRALLQHFAADKSNNAAYIDLKRLSISPESFSIEFILSIRSSRTLEEAKKGLKKTSADLVGKIENELQKIKPDQRLILESALAFPETLEKKPRVILDSFEEFLKLNNFKQIKDCVSLLTRHAQTYIISSAAVHLTGTALKRHEKSFQHITLASLTSDGTKALFESIAGKTDRRVSDNVHTRSAGIPTIIRNIAVRFKEEKTGDTQKDIRLIDYILISELVTESSRSYSYCSRLFTESLNRARGDTLLKTILKAVSQNAPLRLTEIARLIYRSGPVTKSLLERLVEVDLITKTGSTFDFSNPVLKIWCRLYFSSIGFADTPDEKTLESAGALGLVRGGAR
ncbi:hypothetical protein KY362_07030 [Candidatus Woesearchaeota archaeon]|nr:hypothetical protein [Candidatus Woesearchaeota archaeon]